MSLLKKFEVTVKLSALGESDKHLLGPLINMMKTAQGSDAQTFTFSMTAGRKRDDSLDGLPALISSLLKLVGRDNAEARGDSERSIPTLKVTGKKNERLPAEILDLIHGRVFGTHEIQPDADKRYPLKDRWNALMRDHVSWRDEIRR